MPKGLQLAAVTVIAMAAWRRLCHDVRTRSTLAEQRGQRISGGLRLQSSSSYCFADGAGAGASVN